MIARARRYLSAPKRADRALRRQWHALGSTGNRFALAHSREVFVVRVGDEAIGRDLYVRGEFDFHKYEAALAALQRTTIGTLVDVGANIGPICIPALVRGLATTAIAIEPEAINFSLLQANAALNGLDDRMRCVQAAAGATSGGSLWIELADENFGDHRIAATAHASPERGVRTHRMEVPVRTLDDIAGDLDASTDLVWMDVQGYEIEVLRGSRRTMASGVPLVLELQPMLMQEHGGMTDVLDVLSPYGWFRDLSEPASARPLHELGELYDALGTGGAHTDVLLTVEK